MEGVENCVCKNLYSVLFGDNGVGNSLAEKKSGEDPNLPVVFKVSDAHREENEQNAKIRANITRFGNFVEPRHLEIDDSRLI